jgi:hypothetical protein
LRMTTPPRCGMMKAEIGLMSSTPHGEQLSVSTHVFKPGSKVAHLLLECA